MGDMDRRRRQPFLGVPLVRLLVGFFIALVARIRFRLRIFGGNNYLNAPGTLLVMNHKTDWDGPVVGSTVFFWGGRRGVGRTITFLARGDLDRPGFLVNYFFARQFWLKRLLGWVSLRPITAALGIRVVPGLGDREAGPRGWRVEKINQYLQEAGEELKAGGCVLLAPEGRLSPDGALGRLSGALVRLAREARVVQPISLTYDPIHPWRPTLYVSFAPPLRPEEYPQRSLLELEVARRLRAGTVFGLAQTLALLHLSGTGVVLLWRKLLGGSGLAGLDSPGSGKAWHTLGESLQRLAVFLHSMGIEVDPLLLEAGAGRLAARCRQWLKKVCPQGAETSALEDGEAYWLQAHDSYLNEYSREELSCADRSRGGLPYAEPSFGDRSEAERQSGDLSVATRSDTKRSSGDLSFATPSNAKGSLEARLEAKQFRGETALAAHSDARRSSGGRFKAERSCEGKTFASPLHRWLDYWGNEVSDRLTTMSASERKRVWDEAARVGKELTRAVDEGLIADRAGKEAPRSFPRWFPRWLVEVAILAFTLWVIRLTWNRLRWPEMVKAWQGLSGPWGLAGVIVNLLGYVARIPVWQALLAGLPNPPSRREMFELYLSGNFINTFFPLRGGDIARGFYLVRQTGLSLARSLTLILAEHLFDLVVISGYGLVGLLLIPQAPVWASRVVWGFFGGSVFLVGVVSLRRWLPLPKTRLAPSQTPVPKYRRPFVTSLLESLAVLSTILRDKNLRLQLLLGILVANLAFPVSLMAFFRALGSTVPLGALLLSSSLMTIGVGVPLTFANLGTYELIFSSIFSSLTGQPLGEILAVAVVSHLTGLLTVIILGGLGLAHLGYETVQLPKNASASR